MHAYMWSVEAGRALGDLSVVTTVDWCTDNSIDTDALLCKDDLPTKTTILAHFVVGAHIGNWDQCCNASVYVYARMCICIYSMCVLCAIEVVQTVQILWLLPEVDAHHQYSESSPNRTLSKLNPLQTEPSPN
jgi:hypothetical protein